MVWRFGSESFIYIFYFDYGNSVFELVYKLRYIFCSYYMDFMFCKMLNV